MFKYFKKKKLYEQLAFNVSMLRIKQLVLRMQLEHRNESDRLVQFTKGDIKEYESKIDSILDKLRTL
jgi:hypothetical protein